ncbi:zinc-binding alcohol dehydrogenase [soil metagenome]
MAPETAVKPAVEAQAVWFSAPSLAEIQAETVLAPGPGEVRVRAVASAISAGTEMLVYLGRVPPETALDLPTLSGSFGFPIKYGYSAVGRILDAGPDVETLAPGDPVFVHHPHQSVFVAPADMAVRLPDEIDPPLGVFVANLETALNIVHDTPLKLGETAVVFGQGVVGFLVGRLLKMAGARVLVVEPLEKRRGLAAAGVDGVFEPGEGLVDSISEATDGRGADVAIEAGGSSDSLQAAIDCVTDEGTVVAASWYGTKPVELFLGGHFHRGRVKVVSSQVGRLNPGLTPRWDWERRMASVLGLLVDHRLQLEYLISHRFQFSDAPAAYRLIDEHPEETIQVILTYDES